MSTGSSLRPTRLHQEADQAAIRARAEQAGLPAMVADHGYCRSLYLRDPDGLIRDGRVVSALDGLVAA